MWVFFYVDNSTATRIEEQFDTVNAWTRSSVASVNFFNVATLEEGILLCMSGKAFVQICSRSAKTTEAGSFCAVLKSTRNTIIAGCEDMLSLRHKHTSHLPPSTRSA